MYEIKYIGKKHIGEKRIELIILRVINCIVLTGIPNSKFQISDFKLLLNLNYL